MVFTASLLGARHLWEVVENQPASSLVVSLGKAFNGAPPPLCGRQVAQASRKWQFPSECRRPVQNIAIQFVFSCMEDKHEQYSDSFFRIYCGLQLVIQGVHKVRVHFKRFITIFVFAIEIICKKCYKVSSTYFKCSY